MTRVRQFLRSLDGDDWGALFLLSLLAILVTIAGTCAYLVLAADGRVDHCWVTTTSVTGLGTVHELHGHRSYRPDVLITASTSWEAIMQAKQQVCP